jgi:hypothetical protein
MIQQVRVSAFVLWTVLGVLSTHAAESPSIEYQVKAGFIFNYIKFVTWPEDVFPGDLAPIKISILGSDPFGTVIDAMAQETMVKNRKIEITRIVDFDTAHYCHVLFISRSEKRRLHQILPKLRATPTLTISETDKFAEFGGMINFIIVKNKVRFEINVTAATESGLEISSRLLRLAKIVRASND